MTTPNWNLIQSENPHLNFDHIALLGEGWGAWTYRVNHDFVFKLPKRAGDWDENLTEQAVLAFAQPRVPLTVPAPVLYRPTSAGWPHGYAVATFVPGQPIDLPNMTKTQRAAAASALGGFLRALHALEPDDDLRAVLPREGEMGEFQELAELAETKVFPQLSAREAEQARVGVRGYLADDANFYFRPTLIHGDLHHEHILTQEGVVTGIIDFGDAQLGDPNRDFSDFLLELGADFTIACAHAYGHPDPQGLVDKLWRRSLFGYLHDIMFGPEFGLPEDVEGAWAGLREWVRQAG
ncbi:MAG: aminoglycoside phosphotransferase family protein [Caldilineaceae bacterium]